MHLALFQDISAHFTCWPHPRPYLRPSLSCPAPKPDFLTPNSWQNPKPIFLPPNNRKKTKNHAPWGDYFNPNRPPHFNQLFGHTPYQQCDIKILYIGENKMKDRTSFCSAPKSTLPTPLTIF